MIELVDHDSYASETMMIQIIIDRRLKCSLGYRTSYTHLNLIPAPSLMMIIQIVMLMMRVMMVGPGKTDPYRCTKSHIWHFGPMKFWTHTVDRVMIKMILLVTTLRCSKYICTSGRSVLYWNHWFVQNIRFLGPVSEIEGFGAVLWIRCVATQR